MPGRSTTTLTAALALAAALGGCRQTVVLDPGGGQDGATGADVGGSGDRFGAEWCDSISPIPRSPEVVLSVDRSSVMQTTFGDSTRLEYTRRQLVTLIEGYQLIVRFGYQEFPGVTPTCGGGGGGGGCCAGDVSPPIPGASGLIANAMNSCAPPNPCPASPQRPTAAALARCHDVYTRFGGGSGPNRYVLLVTGGEPTCSPDGNPDSPCVAAAGEVTRLRNDDNIRTVVVAVAEPANSDCLENLALTGGAPQSTQQPYYLASFPSELDRALSVIIGEIARDACHFDLPARSVPMDVDRLALFLDGKQIDRNSVDGWELDNGSPFKVTLHGAACDKFVGGPVPVELRTSCDPPRRP